ncbi:MAG: hypothetical protein WAW00_00920 [Candidatus Moraniibacteriota bacterium]
MALETRCASRFSGLDRKAKKCYTSMFLDAASANAKTAKLPSEKGSVFLDDPFGATLHMWGREEWIEENSNEQEVAGGFRVWVRHADRRYDG